MQNSAVSITDFLLGDAGLIGVSAVSLAEDSFQSGAGEIMNMKQTQLCKEGDLLRRSQSRHYYGGFISRSNITENVILVSL